MKRVFFKRNSTCLTHLLLFLLEKQILKSSKWVRLLDSVVGRPGNQMMGHSGDVRGTLVINGF